MGKIGETVGYSLVSRVELNRQKACRFMQPVSDGKWVLPPKLSQVVLRTLRHEVGDLLQTVYAAAAILHHRLPAGWDLERRVVSDMRVRGEACRKYLDFAHDLLSALTLEKENVPVAQELAKVIERISQEYPSLRVHQEIERNLVIRFDAKKLDKVFDLLLDFACEMAWENVWIKARPGENSYSMVATIEYDLDLEASRPQTMSGRSDLGIASLTEDARAQLGLLLAEKLVSLNDGSIQALPCDDSFVRFTIEVPGEKVALVT
jgi:K+-sensing histidine kinase KdpD